jgi:hypothetical protein
VEEDGLVQLLGQLQLLHEPLIVRMRVRESQAHTGTGTETWVAADLLLDVLRREVPIKVEPALAHGHDRLVLELRRTTSCVEMSERLTIMM